jgi:hypothetical protein
LTTGKRTSSTSMSGRGLAYETTKLYRGNELRRTSRDTECLIIRFGAGLYGNR